MRLHDKIGLAGSYPPLFTLSGIPVTPPFLTRHALGGGYFCVGDVTRTGVLDTETIRNDLQALVDSALAVQTEVSANEADE